MYLSDPSRERSRERDTGTSARLYVGLMTPALVLAATAAMAAPAGSEAVDVRPRELRLGSRSIANATVTLSAPPETGAYRRYVSQHRYLAILPTSVIRGLHAVHPWLPVVVIDALIAVPFYLVGVRLLGTGRVRSRSRDGPSLLARLRRRL